ncbi:hypothetical protein [Agrobacterium rubi]|uniref:hypothetical protein n=1 Tax=Agrobacterium rubi TaxID=28099 RepID=UPI0015748120|nr:hypothetical protein [Agrobacterium rubi]NTE87243.1 hypothetical protein [Agrobacterium rubi]NTF03177.1 hypothetical protein [Agrobacterium rubi]
MSAFPKDGSTFVVECIDRTAYRWAKYKPQGAKQMGKPGRWQKMAINGDWHRWENCEEPVGEISPLTEDGPISKAFKQSASIRSLLLELENYFDGRADADCDQDGFIPNDEMRLLTEVREALHGSTA